MKINTNKQEIEYKDLFFPFNAVRRKLQTIFSPNALAQAFGEFCIHKTFNNKTGEIDRKFAWDSIFQSLHEKGLLAQVLDAIIEEEYLS